MKAEVDEFGVLIVSERTANYWLEIAGYTPTSIVVSCRVDSENAPLERVIKATEEIYCLWRWGQTEGIGETAWQRQFGATTPSIAT